MEIVPVDYEKHLDLCMSFRKDAYEISFGNLNGFDEAEVQAWFLTLRVEKERGFYHVIIDGEIVGQLEFINGNTDDDGKRFGYINLLYLIQNIAVKG